VQTHPGALSVFYPPNQYKNRIDYPPPGNQYVKSVLIMSIINMFLRAVINTN
jgi:hypothetical protein